jgi:hypothetical protein
LCFNDGIEKEFQGNNMSGLTLLYFLILIISLLPASSAKAVCPVCTVAVGAGLGFSRWLGIDDLISGVWIGGLIVSLIIWSLNWLNKKQIKFRLNWLAISVIFYGATIIPLYFSGIIGHPLNKFYGIDRALFGTIFGSLVILLSFCLHNFLKKKNQGKVFFPFQKVALPILFLVVTSLIFYFTQ